MLRLLRRFRSAAPIAAFFLIGLAWMLTSPPGTGIDESSHFLRMVGLGHGQLIGDALPADTPFGGLKGSALERVNAEGGRFALPGSLPPPNICNAGRPEQPFNCALLPLVDGDIFQISYHARYLPGAYVIPAILSRAGSSTWRVLLLGRLGFLIQNTVLFGVIVLGLKRSCRGTSAATMSLAALAATPLLAFLSGTLAPSATEVLASVAFLSAFIAALTLRSSKWLWITALAGCSACWSRDLGLVCVVLFSIVALFVVPGAAGWLWSRRRTSDLLAATALIAGFIAAVVWELKFKVGMRVDIDSVAQLLRDLSTTGELLRNSVGLVGWQDVRIDPAIEWVWIVSFIVALTLVVREVCGRVQVAAAALAVAYVALTVYLISGQRAAGFGGQARFTLAIPLAAVVLLISQRQSTQSAQSASTRHVGFRMACIVTGLGHFSTLLISAQRHARGLNAAPIDFDQAVWKPTGGWTAMLILITVASVSLMAMPYPRTLATTVQQ
jgi:hypothetical protein